MRTPYAQGYAAENDLFNRLEKIGYEGKRAFKSQGPYDLMMFNDTFRPLLIEVKYYKAMTLDPNSETNDKTIKKLLKKPNSNKLVARAISVKAYPLFAFKIKGRGYLFYRLDNDTRYFTTYRDLKSGLKRLLKEPPFTTYQG